MSKIIKNYFFFLRHAKTGWNDQNLCQGQQDIPLNEGGYQEAKSAAEKSIGLNIDCIVSSPLCRALETAKEVQHVHADAGLHIVAELSERSWGSLEGISSEEMYAIEKMEERDPSFSPGKGVESRDVFRQRVLNGITIAQAHHQHPFIVSHGRVFLELCHILGVPPVKQLPNCQLVKFSPNSNEWKAHFV